MPALVALLFSYIDIIRSFLTILQLLHLITMIHPFELALRVQSAVVVHLCVPHPSPPAAQTHGARNRCSLMIIFTRICSSLTNHILRWCIFTVLVGCVQARLHLALPACTHPDHSLLFPQNVTSVLHSQ